ncbi:acyltransferase family protein [Roseovarius aquimarinus]|uniref:Acyltransferase family protein n=1 Tax=Roseovarius aquimarinus TaxID=1229156 RepID=A0ABW7IBE0_9RHOB
MNYRPEIDGLRAVAVIPVVLFHAGSGLFSGGFVGVDVFFVISGYLITSIILEQRAEGRFSIIQFYEHRARRILPALFFVLAVTYPLAWAFLMPTPYQDYMRSLAASALFVSNVHFWETSGYFSEASELRPLLHTWSLAVEEQYYLVFPLLMAALGSITFRKHLIWFATIAVLSLMLSEWGWRNHPDANFFFTFSRFWELFVGSICAILVFRREIDGHEGLSILGLAMILVAVFFFDGTTPSPSVYTLIPVVGAALVVLFAKNGTVVARILSLRSLVGIGLISYSVYLWHQPLFAFARVISSHEPARNMMFFLALASFGLAYFTWRYVEQPFRNRAGGLVPKRSSVFAFSLIGIASFSALGVAGQQGGPVTSRATQIIPAHLLNAAYDYGDRTSCLPLGSDFDLGLAVQKCSVRTGAARTVLLVGDSHADHYAAALRLGSDQLGYDFYQLTANSCTPFPNFALYEINCERYATDVAKFLLQTQPDVIVWSQRWTAGFTTAYFTNNEGGVEHGSVNAISIDGFTRGSEVYQDILFERLERSLESLLQQASVVLIGPSPEAGWDVPRKLQEMSLFSPGGYEQLELSTSYSRFNERNGPVMERLTTLEYPDLFHFWPHTSLCDRQVLGRCINFWLGNVLYYDDDHFSNVGSLFIAPELLKVVQQALDD